MKKDKKIRKKELTITFIIMIILLLFFSGYSMGKSYQSINILANGEIAKPILVVENNPAIEINGKNEKEYYNFKVKNSSQNGEINQVDLEYYIEILNNKEESISFKLYKDEKEIKLTNNKTENISIPKGKLEEHNYKLEIIYDKSKNHSIDDIMQDIQIKVHSEQLKA